MLLLSQAVMWLLALRATRTCSELNVKASESALIQLLCKVFHIDPLQGLFWWREAALLQDVKIKLSSFFSCSGVSDVEGPDLIWISDHPHHLSGALLLLGSCFRVFLKFLFNFESQRFKWLCSPLLELTNTVVSVLHEPVPPCLRSIKTKTAIYFACFFYFLCIGYWFALIQVLHKILYFILFHPYCYIILSIFLFDFIFILFHFILFHFNLI